MNKKKIISLIIFIGLVCLTSLVFTSVKAVEIENPIKANTFGQLLTAIAKGVATVVAALGGIMILIAGVLFLTSAGSPEKIGKAKTALLYAVIGIVIGLAGEVIIGVITDTLGVK